MKAPFLITLLAASTYGFLFTSCDSWREEAREDALEQRADSLDKETENVRREGEAAIHEAEIEEAAASLGASFSHRRR